MKTVKKFDELEKYSMFGIRTSFSGDEIWLMVGKVIGFRVDKDIRETKYSQFQTAVKKAVIEVKHVVGLDKYANSLNHFFLSLLIGQKEVGKRYYMKNRFESQGKDWAELVWLENESDIDHVKKCMMVENL